MGVVVVVVVVVVVAVLFVVAAIDMEGCSTASLAEWPALLARVRVVVGSSSLRLVGVAWWLAIRLASAAVCIIIRCDELDEEEVEDAEADIDVEWRCGAFVDDHAAGGAGKLLLLLLGVLAALAERGSPRLTVTLLTSMRLTCDSSSPSS